MRTGCIRPQSERSAQVKGVVLLGEMKQVRQLLILQRVAQAPGVALVHAGLAPLQLVEQSMRRGRHRECEQPMGSAGLCSLERESGNLTVVTAIGVRIRPFCYAQRRCNAQQHDAQRRYGQRLDARRPCHPDDDDTPNVKRKRRLKGLALAVCFIPKSQTCNGYELNSFR